MIKELYSTVFGLLDGQITIGGTVIPVSSRSLTNAMYSIQLLSYNANSTDTKVDRISNVVINIDCVSKNGTVDGLADIVDQVEAIMKPAVESALSIGEGFNVIWVNNAIHLNYKELWQTEDIEHTTLRYEMEIQTL